MPEFPYVIDTGLTWPSGRGSMRKITDHIQVHHTVGFYGTPAKWAALHKRKMEKDGHRGVGYSYLVTQDGQIFRGRGHEYGHGGVKDSITNNANQRSIAIAFDGDMRESGLPTQAQWQAGLRLVRDLMALYKLSSGAVLGHNEIPVYSGGKPTGKLYATACPCIDMNAFRAALGGTSLEATPEDKAPDVNDDREDLDQAYPAEYSYIGATYVNLRESINGTVIGRVSAGERVIVLGISGEWAEIITHQTIPMRRGWCISKYLREV